MWTEMDQSKKRKKNDRTKIRSSKFDPQADQMNHTLVG